MNNICSEHRSDREAMASLSTSIIILIAFTEINYQFANASHSSRDVYLIVGLPLQSYGKDECAAVIWKRGKEILPGAQIAVENINNRTDILPGHTLHIVEVDIGKCGQQNNQKFLLEFVNLTFHQHFSVIGAIGLFCPTEVQITTPLLGTYMYNSLVKEKILKLSVKASYTTIGPGKLIQRMIQALLDFFEVLEWRNVAAITDNGDKFFSYVVEKLYQTSASMHINGSKVNVIVHNYAQSISQLKLDLPRIILISIRTPLAIELLCNAYREDLVWPKHVWILHTHQLLEIANLNTSCDDVIELVLENVLIINEDTHVSMNFTDIHKKSTYKHKPTNWYSHKLYNLVWSVVLATNSTLNEKQFLPKITSVALPKRGMKIVQVKNFSEISVAMYSDQLTFSDPTFIVNAPSDKLLRVFEGATSAYTAIFTIEIIGGFVFVTIMLFGYSFFRQEPEIKSTSFSLSLLVFLGCYLLLIYLSILLYFHQPWATSSQTLDGLCISLNWFSGLGIPTALILVTSLVKILRIYYIFNKNTATALSKTCSDTYLATYVILIVSPMIFFHTIWTIIDPYLGFLKITAELDTIQYQKQCKSTYTMLWYSLLAVYMIIIFLILVVVAIKMRKIHKSHFKDTKKVITLVSCYFLDLILTLACWRVLYTAVNAYLAAIVLHIGHFTAIALCQLLLFAPKVFPPLIRYIKKCQTHEHAHDDASTYYSYQTAIGTECNH